MKSIEIKILNYKILDYHNPEIFSKIKENLTKKNKILLSRLDGDVKYLIEQDVINLLQSKRRYPNAKPLNNDNYWFKYIGQDKIYIYPKIKGGLFGSSFNPLSPIIDGFNDYVITPLKEIGKIFVYLWKMLVIIFKGFVWLFLLFKWFFVDFLRPIALLKDVIGGAVALTRLIFVGFVDVMVGLFRWLINTLFTPVFGGLWGWDQDELGKEDEFINTKGEKQKNGLVEKGCGNDGSRKCYRTSDGKVPFSIIIATILLPPLGVFMEFGLGHWINIIICICLTMVYYLPGLIYAFLLIYA